MLCCICTALHCIALHCIVLYVLFPWCLSISRNGDPGSDSVFRKLVNQREPLTTVKSFVLFISFLDFIHSLVPGLFHLSREKKPWGRGWLCLCARSVKGKLFPFCILTTILNFASAFPVEGLHQSTLAAKTRTVIKLARPSP